MMTAKTEKRASRCCFTGHRPEKLHIPEYAVKERLGQAIDIAIDNGAVRPTFGVHYRARMG